MLNVEIDIYKKWRMGGNYVPKLNVCQGISKLPRGDKKWLST